MEQYQTHRIALNYLSMYARRRGRDILSVNDDCLRKIFGVERNIRSTRLRSFISMAREFFPHVAESYPHGKYQNDTFGVWMGFKPLVPRALHAANGIEIEDITDAQRIPTIETMARRMSLVVNGFKSINYIQLDDNGRSWMRVFGHEMFVRDVDDEYKHHWYSNYIHWKQNGARDPRPIHFVQNQDGVYTIHGQFGVLTNVCPSQLDLCNLHAIAETVAEFMPKELWSALPMDTRPLNRNSEYTERKRLVHNAVALDFPDAIRNGVNSQSDMCNRVIKALTDQYMRSDAV